MFKEENGLVLKSAITLCRDVISSTFKSVIEGKEPVKTWEEKQDEIETCVWVDIHIDGVSLFENSSVNQVIYYKILKKFLVTT